LSKSIVELAAEEDLVTPCPWSRSSAIEVVVPADVKHGILKVEPGSFEVASD
jgi:hypothetical protein